ncbi:phosphodiester glycosidase family protein [Streptomyces sp. N2-109]|uniref:Phosphodiester glycosidase family protein n=1 Tax=Streptomyces gossypii TaxID=2883101 RepID=A0ABT2K150_9ACTN|nr:phosphodiester glycosidase family protein [Streptomyces gossypii]MCT2593886.1 phosphodiester glycosidase family protein [Streptomyces gossypii]
MAGLAPSAHGAPAPSGATARHAVPAASGSAQHGRTANDGPGADDGGMELSRASRPVAPGTTLTSFDRLNPGKWLRADALSVDLKGGARFDYLSSGKVSERGTVTELAKAHNPGEGRRTVAALNADFFDINETGAPLSPGVRDGKPTHSPAPGNSTVVGIGPQSAGRILDLYFEGSVTLPDGEQPLDAYNAANVPDGGIGVYNAQWGAADRALTTDGASGTTEVTVRDGKVASVSGEPGKGDIPTGSTVLLGRDAGAEKLAQLETGDPVSVEYDVRTDDGSEVPRTAVGGRGVLVEDGEPQDWEGRPNNATAPRTAVGFSKDGSTMHVLTVDGRQAASGGVTLTELARMMDELGAHDALNLDGGGSSTLVAREPGSDTTQLANAPSDGQEREVPNGLALTAPDGSGRLKGFWVETAADPAKAPTADNVPGGHPERVFPGLTRQLTAAGYDESYGPAEGSPHWRVGTPRIGRVDKDGTFHARRGGTTEVTARSRRAEGSTKLEVIGELDRVRASQERVGLAKQGDKGTFGIIGYDARGTSAPIDPADVELDYDRSLFTVTPDPAGGGFTVSARKADASGQVTATVDGHTTVLGVTAGLRDQRVADFEDAADWKFSAARAEGSVSAEPAGQEGTGLRLDYDFTKSTATRAAYVSPPGHTAVPGQPQSFTLSLKGDGKGAWPSLQLTDAEGTSQVLRGPHVDWEGWRQITFEVPEGVSYPLDLRRFYLAETRSAEQYSSSVVIDELTAQTPPDLELPAAEPVRDPLISTASDVRGHDWRFAVMSDAQFVARDPDSEIVRQARRTLREIRAAEPDFVVVNGDLVDEGSPADLAFARSVLEDELGDAVPWYYVPGNHEIMGGKIDNFVQEFGPAQRTFDHKGTRFLTLDTSSLTLRGGGFGQIEELREQLDAARRDPAVRSVAVIQHTPPRDPTPQEASRLTDRLEADLLEDWLGDFRARSGKGVMFIGSHVGVFDASRVDGVPYLINGNSGKAPAAPAAEGGFTGWSMVGVDRQGKERFAVQTRAHVDGLVLEAPAELRVGASGKAGATVHQGTGDKVREVPVGWPLSADWSGSGNLCVDGEHRKGEKKKRCVASYDPVTGTLKALRAGTVTLEVKVNGARAEREVVLRR